MSGCCSSIRDSSAAAHIAMLAGEPPGIDPTVAKVKRLEYELEMAWKKLAERRAHSERVYINLLKMRRDGPWSAAGKAFVEWQRFRSDHFSAQSEYDRVYAELLEASRAAQRAIVKSADREPPA